MEATKKLTRDQLLVELRKMHAFNDPEVAHSYADDLLLAYIDDKEVKQAFEDVPRWYA